jgi:AmmeMemoRadiSam system protein B
MEFPDVNFSSVRPAAVAGKFYPGDAQMLRQAVAALLSKVEPSAGLIPKALIVPHAGYVYSGPVAAAGFARLAAGRGLVKRIVLVGPSHYVRFAGIATCSAVAFETPLGRVPVDRALLASVERLPQVKCLDKVHAPEHALEVELPFLQELLPDFTLLPLIVGQASPDEVSQVLEAVWGGSETGVLISSDLSHYHHWAEARKLDAETGESIVALATVGIRSDQACGAIPISGLLQSARRHGLISQILALRNSGDTAGTRDRVVGYGAFSFT